jgi:hypothetical protein
MVSESNSLGAKGLAGELPDPPPIRHLECRDRLDRIEPRPTRDELWGLDERIALLDQRVQVSTRSGACPASSAARFGGKSETSRVLDPAKLGSRIAARSRGASVA